MSAAARVLDLLTQRRRRLNGVNLRRLVSFALIPGIPLILAIAMLSPKALGIYFTSKGSHILYQALASPGIDLTRGITCELDPATSPNAFALADQAIGYLQKAILYSPKGSQAYLLLGRAYCLKGQPESAVQSYVSYTQIRPGNPLGHLELGFAYEAVCKKDGQSAENMLPMAGVSTCSGPSLADKMRSEWKRGVSVQDFLAEGTQARLAKNYGQAVEWYNRAVFMQSPGAEFYLLFTEGLLAKESGAWDEALTFFHQLVEKGQFRKYPLSSSYYQIGLIQKDQLKDWESALKYFDLAVSTDDYLSSWDRADTHYQRGVILRYKGDKFSALREFQQAVDALPYHYGALIELGWAYWDLMRDFQMAESTLQGAIKMSPDAKWAYITLGDVCMEAGDYENALSLYQTVIKLDPSDVETRNKITKLESPEK